MDTFTQTTGPQDKGLVLRNPDESSTRFAVEPLEQKEIVLQDKFPPLAGLFVVQDFDLTAIQRLVVLIPNLDVDETAIARKIWDLAFPARLSVLLLGLCPNLPEESNVRRRLITIAALIREPRISVEMQLGFGRNWAKSLKNVLHFGDVIICPANQQTGILLQPLDVALANLGFPIITLEGFQSQIRRPLLHFIQESIFWMISLAVIFIFFWFQIRISRISEEWARNALLSLTVMIEFGLIGIWNNLSH
jgi:hypothetical protein